MGLMSSSSASPWARFVAAFIGFLVAFAVAGAALDREVLQPDEVHSDSFAIAIDASGVSEGDSNASDSEDSAVEVLERLAAGGAWNLETAPLDRGVFVQGRVATLDGIQTEPAVVVAMRDGQELARNRVDREGRYVLGPFLEPRVELVAYRRHCLEVRKDLKLDPSVRFERVDFVLHRQPRLKVFVETPEGESLHRALAERHSSLIRFDSAPVATLERPGPRFALRGSDPEQQDEIGVWERLGREAPRFGASDFGWLFLQRGPPCWVSFVAGGRVLASQYVGPEISEVRFVFDPEEILILSTRLHGRVLSAFDGKPIEGARILHANPATGRGNAVKSDDEGYFWIESASPAGTQLTLRAEGFATVQREVIVEPQENHDVGLLLLEPEIRIRGTLLGEDDQPVPGQFRVGVYDAKRGRADWSMNRFVLSDSAGAFEVNELAGGTYVLQPGDLKGPSGLPVVVDTTFGPRAEVELRLQEATASQGW